MFSSPSGDKENVFGEVFTTTPSRKPLKMVQMGAAEGTPLSITKRTPRPRSTRASTPSSRRLARRLKRQSVPFPLSKPLSIFEDDANTKSIFKENAEVEESLYLKRNGQELNEMIREKVSETVIKLKERYEANLAEKERNLDEKNNIIEKLQSEMDRLKQSKTDFGQSRKAITEDRNVSLFVQDIITKAVHEIERENSSSPQTGVKNPDSFVYSAQNTSARTKRDSCSTMTPKKYVSAETSPVKMGLTEKGTSMTPVLKMHSSTSVTPVETVDAMLCTSPANVQDAILSTFSPRVTDSSTLTSPVCLNDSTVCIVPDTIGDQDQVQRTPKKTEHELQPKVLNVSEAGIFLTPTQEEHETEAFTIHIKSEGNVVNTTIKESCIDVGTSMTPVELVNKHTTVSPTQTSNASVSTSPLVAVLQPKIISSLPLNRLKAELESAAISNELLRSECDELNGKIEELQLCLTEATKETEKKCKSMQDEINSLERKLEEALEINYQMEMKKPFTVEEYDETISRLQKDILLKEKQITFYTKKASEAENLQKDMRRMYAKYNTEHQLYTKLDEETKILTEQYNNKCIENESLQTELCAVKELLEKAQRTIDEQHKVREEAKESQVKCCTLEQQIEAFQSQQKENLEFLEQERKGLEETTTELEQLVKARTEELDATRLALDEKTEQHEQMRETVHKLRDQLSEINEELVAVQSQAYLVMLEQEKELTEVSGVLEETWERLTAFVETCRQQARTRDEPTAENESEDKPRDDYKPSFVYSVLAAVSGTVPQSSDVEVSQNEDDTAPSKDMTETKDSDEMMMSNEGPGIIKKKNSEISDDFTLVSRAKAFQKLILELENYVQDGNEHAQMIIQRQVDEIANLEESLCEVKQQCEETTKSLKQELENEECKVKKIQRDNDNKQNEIESLKLELKTVEQSFETSREHMRELGNRCCALIEQETENQVLNEKLRHIQQELEKAKQDKSCLEKELSETVERLQRLVEASEEHDKEKQTSVLRESFTELLDKKMHLGREVEKLRNSFAKVQRENETFAQYNARLENKASILGSNLLRAEEEIYRLDGIVDRFCTATQNCWQTMTPSQDLLDLLQELNIALE